MPRTLWIALSPDPARIAEACGVLAPSDEHYLIAPANVECDEAAWRAAGAHLVARPRRLTWTDVRLRRRVRSLGIERYVVISHGMQTAIEPLLSWWALGQPAEFLRYAPAWRADEQRFETRPCFWYTKREPLLNRHGVRGEFRAAAGERGAARVACVGGSTTYGSGYLPGNLEMRAADSYPAWLQRLGGWHVLNLGITGLGAACQTARLLRYRTWRPDVVIVHAGYNDLPIVVDASGGEYRYIAPDLDRPACLGRLVDYYAATGWRARVRRLSDEIARRPPALGDTYLGHDLAAAAAPRTGSADDVARESERRGRHFMRGIIGLVGAALSLGARVLVLGQPAIRPGTWAWRPSLRAPESAPLLACLHRKQQEALRAHLDRHFGHCRSYRYVDLYDAFASDYGKLHIDEVHLGPAGNRRLAELLVPHVAALLAEPVRPVSESTAPAASRWHSALAAAVNIVRRVRRAPLRDRPPGRSDDSPFIYPLW